MLAARARGRGPAPRPASLFTRTGGLRILLAHFPDVVDDLSDGACSLVLAGHLHGGQICLPSRVGGCGCRTPAGATWTASTGSGEATLVVSRGTGTTLVPFRLLARPEVSLLRLTGE